MTSSAYQKWAPFSPRFHSIVLPPHRNLCKWKYLMASEWTHTRWWWRKGLFSEKSLIRSIKKHDNDDASFLKQSIRSMWTKKKGTREATQKGKSPEGKSLTISPAKMTFPTSDDTDVVVGAADAAFLFPFLFMCEYRKEGHFHERFNHSTRLILHALLLASVIMYERNRRDGR